MIFFWNKIKGDQKHYCKKIWLPRSIFHSSNIFKNWINITFLFINSFSWLTTGKIHITWQKVTHRYLRHYSHFELASTQKRDSTIVVVIVCVWPHPLGLSSTLVDGSNFDDDGTLRHDFADECHPLWYYAGGVCWMLSWWPRWQQRFDLHDKFFFVGDWNVRYKETGHDTSTWQPCLP